MDPARLLAATALFEGADPDELRPLMPALHRRSLARREYLWRIGEVAEAAYLLLRGEIKVFNTTPDGQEAVVALMLPGDLLGEYPLLLFEDAAERIFDAQALSPSECLGIPRQAFVAFLEGHPRVMQRIIAALARWIRRESEAATQAAFLDISGRVLQQLRELADVHGQHTEDGIRLPVRLGQVTLAGMVGASRENTNRALARLERQGVLRREGGWLVLLAPAQAGHVSARGG